MAMEDFGKTVNEGRELGWDDTINKESGFVLLTPGDYDFTVSKVERERYGGGKSIPQCNMAVVSILIKTPQGDAVVPHRLYLHTSCEGLLSEFFISIGQKKHGEPLIMNWNKVVGATGRCKVTNREYKGDMYNNIKRFYEKKEAAAPAPKTVQPGVF